MAIPSRVRSVLHQNSGMQLSSDMQRSSSSTQLIVTIDTESPCLLLYPTPVWEIIEAKLQGLSSFNPASRRIQRLLLGHASELELDTNGRVLLPPMLRDYAGLTKKAIVVGQCKKLEVWDEAAWTREREQWLAEGIATAEMPPELLTLSL